MYQSCVPNLANSIFNVTGFRALREALGMASTTGEEPIEATAELESVATADDLDIDWIFGPSRSFAHFTS